MLTKVLKYDFKSNGKILIPLYLLVIALCTLTRIIYIGADLSPIFATLSFFTNIFGLASIIGLIFMTFYTCFRRFYNTIYKSEGYLTNTLPVKRADLITSKLINTIIFAITTFFISIFSLYIMYFKIDLVQNIALTLKELKPFLIPMITLIILQFILIYMLFCTAYAIAAQCKKNKGIMGLVFGFIIYVSFQIINLLALLILTKFNPDLFNLINNMDIKAMNILLYTVAIIAITYITILYFILINIYKNKFNLE